MSGPHLRPDPGVLGDEWQTIVVEEYEQVERLREWRDEDYYNPQVAQHFADDPHRAGDEILDYLRSLSSPEKTWLDIGAGGGRYALPLALVNRCVIAVEPSPGMLGVLRTGMAQYDIDNINVVEGRWPAVASGIQADICLMSHVGYDIREINPFLDAAESATSSLCIATMMDRAPSGGFIRLWEQVHGEPRQQLPAMREFVHLLLARGATPEITICTFPQRDRDEDELRKSARRRLWLVEGSEKDRRLQELLSKELNAGVDDYQTPILIAIITWESVGKSST